MSIGFFELGSGIVISLLYLLAMLVDSIFAGFMALLVNLNPFKLLYSAVAGISPTFAEGMTGGDTSAWGPLVGLAAFVSEIYTFMSQAAWGLMVPLFLGILLFSLLMFKKLDKGGALKKIFIRVLFIGLGVPLLGAMYTGTVTSMAEATTGGNMGATQVVLSTYVDFESWANNTRLAIPEGATIEWRAARGQPSTDATMHVRDSALAINASAREEWSGVAPLTTDEYSMGWSTSGLNTAETDHAGSTYMAVLDMMTRYMRGDKVESGSFESDAKGRLTAANVGGTEEWFSSIREGNIEAPEPGVSANPVLSVASGTGLTRTAVAGYGDSADGVDEGSWVRDYTTVGVDDACGSEVSNSSGQPLACNMSSLAMYNYLNTSFDSSSMISYSSNKVMSGATRESHNAVTQVGTGAMGFLYWLNSVALLGAFVTIGLGYALGMLIGNIRRGIQTISAIPFATLGAIAAIAKVVIYTIAMLLEVVLTLFLYKMVQELLMAIPTIIEFPFSLILNGSDDFAANAGFFAFLTAGGALTIAITLLSIIGIIIFTVMAMRLRKTLMKAIEEAVTKLIEKLMDTQSGMPSGGKMMPAMAGGLAAGAGAAGANRMMNGAANKGAAATSGAGAGGGSGPEAVETAGGTTAAGTGAAPGDAAHGELSPAASEGQRALPAGSGGSGGSGDSAADEVSLGREVEANGLSKPKEISAPNVGDDDALGDAAASMDKSAEGFKDADKEKLGAAKEGVKATGHAALAVGKGAAGDASGAAESGGRAVEHGGAAVAAGHEAKQKEADAGRSSLDKPNQKDAKKAQTARQVSQVGGAVANTAGKSKGVSGSTPAASATSKGSAVKPSTGSQSNRSQTPKPAQQGFVKPVQTDTSKPTAGQKPSVPSTSKSTPSAPKPDQQGPAKPVQINTPKSTPSAPRSTQQPVQQAPRQMSSRVAAAPKPAAKQGSPVAPKPAAQPVAKPVSRPTGHGPKNPKNSNGGHSNR
jgi:hypothetical protein